MTQVAVDQQIQAIQTVTKEALKSKETALKFLVDAGIVKSQTETPRINTPKPPQGKKH